MNQQNAQQQSAITENDKVVPVGGNLFEMAETLLDYEPGDDSFQKFIDSTSQSIRVTLSEGVLKIHKSETGTLTIAYNSMLISDSIILNARSSILPDDMEDLFRTVSEAVLKIEKR